MTRDLTKNTHARTQDESRRSCMECCRITMTMAMGNSDDNDDDETHTQ